jgi:hypothetical protein
LISVEDREEKRVPTWQLQAGVAVALGGLAAAAYVLDRLYGRWWSANHPFAGAKARVRRVRIVVHDRRAGAAEAAGVVWELVSEVDRAVEQAANDRRREG